MREHVIGLVRGVIRKHKLPACPTWQEVIDALELPPLQYVNLHDKDGARHGRQIIVSTHVTCSERIVFTIFHEIVHILIDEDGEIPSELHEHFYEIKDDAAETRVLESLCNTGAAEFVMPLADFFPMMRDANWRIAALPSIVERFKCSGVAAGFQFALNHPKHCILLICEHGLPPIWH